MKKWLMALFTVLACTFAVSCMGLENAHTHNYAEKTYEPTCTEQGYTEKVCTVCQKSEKYDFVDSKGHDYAKKTVSATCTERGYDLYTCNVCGDTKKENFKDALDHAYGYKVVAPTCEEQGYTLYTCQRCADTYRDGFVTPLDHVAGDWITTKAPTCLEPGKRIKTCVMCGMEMVSGQISVTEHSYVVYSTVEPSESENGYVTYKCTICGSSYRGEYVKTETENTAEDVYNLIKDATVHITAYTKQGRGFSMGSGFFISSDGEIITNYHVIKSAYALEVTLLSGEKYVVSSVISYDSEQDIAMLKINLSDTPFIKISSEGVKTGDTVYALGSSLGLVDSFSSGIVANPDRLISGMSYIQMTAPISSGNSGGPLVNSKGELVGINTMTATYGQNMNFAIKAEVIGGLSKTYNKSVIQLYNDKIGENVFDILKIYVLTNATEGDGVNYAITLGEAETETSYGTETRFIYDSENNVMNIEHDIISGGAVRFTLYMSFNKVNSSYNVYLYDYSMGQFGIEASVDGSKATGTYEESFDEAVNVKTIRYPETSEDEAQYTKDSAKRLFYDAYQSMIVQMNNLIEGSDTGIALGHFNLALPNS